MYIEFARIEFEGVDGVVRTTYGCSAIGAIEFDERTQELRSALGSLDGDESVETLYRSHGRIRHLVNRCLELNNLDPGWVNWDMISQLLFGRRNEDGTVAEGWLITLNKPVSKKSSNVADTTIALTDKAAVIAAIATHCSIEEAYRLADSVPASELWAVLDNKNHFEKPPQMRAKEKEQEQFSSWVERRKAEYKKGLTANG